MNIHAKQGVYTSGEQPKLNKQEEYFDRLHQQKYRDENQTKLEHSNQMADRLASDYTHKTKLEYIFSKDRFLPAGRVQAALGATEREVSPFNCSVSQRINDSMSSIMAGCSTAASILRLGTGIGFNFSHLRPKGALIKKTQTQSSGPLSFMKIYDVMASTIASSGHRRGAMMGIMNDSHPDIEQFIDAKMEAGAYRQFNLSVGVSDKFMLAVNDDADWVLHFGGVTYKTLKARDLWNKMIRNAYDSAEPGVVYLDRMNAKNNLWYCEEIEATNPCSEQPLPPYGLCMLGSFNLVAYVFQRKNGDIDFDFPGFKHDIHAIVEAYDNIFDDTVYAIKEHEEEAVAKRRVGIGLTGIANAIEYALGIPSYGNQEFCVVLDKICEVLATECYQASINLAKKRGPFPLFNVDEYLRSEFIETMPTVIKQQIREHGIRNSHLISYAPCGTISQCAGNVSSGVEPVFYHAVERDVHMKDGKEKVILEDFIFRHTKFKCKTLNDCTVEDHMNVAKTVQRWCDSAVSKTVNVAKDCSYEDYQGIYKQAHEVGLKGITVYRPTELRGAVIVEAKGETNDQAIDSGVDLHNASCASGACER